MNNNLHDSTKARCKCGRYMSLGEEAAGISHLGYKCPDCTHRMFSKPLTPEEFYEQMNRIPCNNS